MGFRFRKSVKLIPGVKLNFSKRGTSVTIGGRGASVNVGSRGTHANVGIPGSGLSYRTRLDGGQTNRKGINKNLATTQNLPGSFVGGFLRWLFGVSFILTGVAIFNQFLLPSFCYITSGVLLLPPLANYFRQRFSISSGTNILIVLAVLMFGSTFIASNQRPLTTAASVPAPTDKRITATAAVTLAQPDAVITALQALHDYSVEDGSLKLLSAQPLHIQLAPKFLPSELDHPAAKERTLIEAMLARTLLYGVYRSFIHTDVPEITVTAVPLVKNPTSGTQQYLQPLAQRIRVSREAALSAAIRVLGIDRFEDMITTRWQNGIEYKNQWSERFELGYYSDLKPGLDVFITTLMSVSAKD